MYYGSQRSSGTVKRALAIALVTTLISAVCFVSKASNDSVLEEQIEPEETQVVQSQTITMPTLYTGVGYPFGVRHLILQEDPTLLGLDLVATTTENSIIEKNETAEFSPNNSAEETTTPAPEETEPARENTIYRVVTESEEGELAVEYQDYLWEMCKKYEVTEYYTLFLAQMWHESRYDVDAISKTHDYGLMQINQCNHSWLRDDLGVSDFLDPYQSIECGVYIMSDFLHKYNDVQTALVCYNKGESAVKNGTYSTSYSRCVIADMGYLVEVEN